MKHRRNLKGWWPEMYEGKSPEQVRAVVGTAVSSPEYVPKSDDSYLWYKVAGHYDRNVHVHY